MKKTNFMVRLISIITVCSCLSFSAFAEDINSGSAQHEPITQQLMTMVEHNLELKKMLIESI
jgi:hypothetical protein